MAGPQGLAKQTHSVPIGGGIDTKTPSPLVGEQSLVAIQNGRFVQGTNSGKLQSRNGFLTLNNTPLGGGFLNNGQAMAQLNGELDIIANSELYAFSISQDVWIPRGSMPTAIPTLESIARTNFDQSAVDSVTLAGITVYAWEDARGGVWFKVIENGGPVLQPETQLDPDGVNPRVIAQGVSNQINILYTAGNSSNIFQAPISIHAATVAPTPSIVVACFSYSPFEIIQLSNGNLGLAILGTSSYPCAYILSGSSLAVINSQTPLVSVAVGQISCVESGNGNFVVAAQVAGIGPQTMYVYFLNPSTCATITDYSHAIQGGAVFGMAPILTATTTITTYVNVAAVSSTGATPYINQINWDQITGYGGGGYFARGCELVAAPFGEGSSIYLLVMFVSEIQPTFFLITASGQIVGRYVSLDAAAPTFGLNHLVTNSNFPYFNQRLSHSSIPMGGSQQLAVLIESELESSGGQPVIVTGIDLLTIQFNPVQIKSIQLGEDLTFSGGLPQIYDSESVTENGFNYFPESPTLHLLTSMIGITDIVDGTDTIAPPAVAQSFTITIPQNQVTTGQDGELLTNPSYSFAEYIIIGTEAFWFSVSGHGSAPSLGGITLNEVIIGADWSAEQIAEALGAPGTDTAPGYINLVFGGVGYTATYSGNQVMVTATSTGHATRPQTYSQFQVNQLSYGSGLSNASIGVNCVGWGLIQPGQYFTYYGTPTNTGLTTQVYAWFTMDGVGTDPKPFGIATGYEIDLLSTDSETQVAVKVAAALPGSNSNDGPIATITNPYDGLADGPPNPGNVGAGLGTVGPGVAINQWDSYTYASMFESQDAQGQLGRSGLSKPTQIYIPAYGLANAQVDVFQQPLYLTTRPSVDVVIYRTQTNGNLLYRDTSEINLLFNNPNVNYLVYRDVVPDATLQSNELCYTQPLIPNSVIPNNCPPPFTQAAIFSGQDQLWINDCEDPQLWWFSKPFQGGVQVEWSDEQTWRFDPVAGPTVAAITMDSNLIVFGTKGIWAVNGLGLDPTGAGSPFTVTLISSAVGLRDPGSLVLTPNGILFMSSKGIQLLDRGLQIARRSNGTYWGSPVEAYNGLPIVSTQVIPDTTEIRFLGEAGSIESLLYDYQFDQWSISTNSGVDSMIYEGNYYFLQENSALVFYEVSGLFSDNGTPFTWGFTTAWFKPSALQGFARIWKAFLQGSFPAGVGLSIGIAYDYDPTIVDSFIYTPAGFAPESVSQIKIYPSRGPCESVQFTVVDTGTLNTQFKYFVNMLDLEIGVKKGSYKKLGPPNTI
jgi:hypothetical protein